MAGYPGSVGLTGYIAPADTLDTYALQSEVFNRGGYRTVADTVDRDAITVDRRKLGMLVYCLSDSVFYTLKSGLTNADWEVAEIGGIKTSSTTYNSNGDEVWIEDKNVMNVLAWDTSSNLSIYVQDLSSEWVDGRIVFVNIDSNAIGSGDASLYTFGGNYILYGGVLTQSLSIPRGTTAILQFMDNGVDKHILVYFARVEEKPNNRWDNADNSGVAYMQPLTTAQNIPISGIVNLGAFTKISGDGVADYILPTIDYFNINLNGAIYMIRHSHDTPINTYENIRILPDNTTGDDIYDSRFISMSEIILKPGETVILQCIFDDPMNWIYLGKIGETLTNNENWEDIPSDSSVTLGGYYFTYGNNRVLTLTTDGVDKRFVVKCVSGNTILKADNNTFDGIVQDINMSTGSSTEVLVRDDKFFISSMY